MNVLTRVSPFLCLLSALMGFGCVAGADEVGTSEHAGDEPVGTVEQAFTNGWWSVRHYGPNDTNTGLSASSWTCFLSGVGETMFSGIGSGGYSGYAGAYIDANNYWHFLTRYPWNVSTYGPSAAIMCVPAPNVGGLKSYERTNYRNTGVVTLDSSGNPNRICGLVAVYDDTDQSSGESHVWYTQGSGTLGGTGDTAYVKHSGNYWTLQGSGNSEAIATCVDHPTTGYNIYSGYGSGTMPLLTANINTVQCFLYGLSADLSSTFTNNPDPTNGVWLNYNSTTQLWSATMMSGKGFGAHCIQ